MPNDFRRVDKGDMINIDEYILKTKQERTAHIDLSQKCIESKNRTSKTKKILSEFLDTNIPSGYKIILCHACNNEKCLNPKHLYWGTQYENIVDDGKIYGTWENPSKRTIDKYGEETAKKLWASGDKSAGGKANSGIVKSEEHKKKIAEAIKKYWENKKK